MENFVFLIFILFACQEKTDYDAELDDIRAQLYQQQITIDELQARIALLNQENETIKNDLYSITSGVDTVSYTHLTLPTNREV